jgi:RHS repeat-associated protein
MGARVSNVRQSLRKDSPSSEYAKPQILRRRARQLWPRLSYAGQTADPPQGLLHFHARSYQPHCGDWLQADPWGGLMDRPTSLNKYDYAENNPVTYADYLGYMRPTDDGGPGSTIPSRCLP